MSDLQTEVRSVIQSFLSKRQEEHIAIDVLRIIAEESHLMKETQAVCDRIQRDPFQRFEPHEKHLANFLQRIRVASCSRIRTGFDHCEIRSVVSVPCSKHHHMQLTFRYQRTTTPHESPACRVWYSIELSYDCGPREKLLVVEVFAPKGVPSVEPAKKEYPDETADDNSDVGVEQTQQERTATTIPDEESEQHPMKKKQKLHQSCTGKAVVPTFTVEESSNDDGEIATSALLDEEDDDDSFAAHLDPDLLHSFLESAKLTSMDDSAAFFLLMTFPFYEEEWDLIGFVLEDVFGSNSDDESNDDECGSLA